MVGIVGVADETTLAKKGAKKPSREEHAKQKTPGEPKKPSGNGFCVAGSYLPQLGCIASL
ncbi:hypothetical protein ACFPYI_20365 [Halomarina salina]|uniref:Uncharacterized protein n=1 Tax=Halomarina salina TaxID=1872699 RepID=A0ABD5RT84_9EURY|nr:MULTISPECIES: hypothetical protein [Haloarculaceae]